MDISWERNLLFCGDKLAETARQNRSTRKWSDWHHYKNNFTPLVEGKSVERTTAF